MSCQKLLMLIFLIILSLVGCAKQQPEQYACKGAAERPASIDPAGLWEDATRTTIGVTTGLSWGLSWTNKVELADINGDRLVDVLFANGGESGMPREWVERSYSNLRRFARMLRLSWRARV
jgi:hypothetical protein